MVLGTFLFAHSLHTSLRSGQGRTDQGGRTGWTRGLQTERSFPNKDDFRQSSEVVQGKFYLTTLLLRKEILIYGSALNVDRNDFFLKKGV